jgi:hypothetical protein
MVYKLELSESWIIQLERVLINQKSMVRMLAIIDRHGSSDPSYY